MEIENPDGILNQKGIREEIEVQKCVEKRMYFHKVLIFLGKTLNKIHERERVGEVLTLPVPFQVPQQLLGNWLSSLNYSHKTHKSY